MTDASTCKITCLTCQLEAHVHIAPDHPYTVTFDSTQFAEKCHSPMKTASFNCIELDLAISVLTQQR